jgi:hypothetical protein
VAAVLLPESYKRRVPKRLAAIVLCGLGIAACGSSSSHGQTTSNPKDYSQGLAFANCMREHGVSNFPDPGAGGQNSGQIRITSNSGVSLQSPAYRSAQSACRHLLPAGGPGSGPPSAQTKAQMLQVSECMRAHGISGFPDPTTSPPSSTAGDSAVMERNGVFLAIPSSIDVKSPGFKRAAVACNFGPKGGTERQSG